MKKNVLFLCTGNSCRSQMAEGWGKSLKGDKFNFYSAGTKKHGLNPRAVQVMKEVGVDISAHESKTTDELPKVTMDFVFTVCSDAHENCPYFPGGKIIHTGFDDPPRLTKEMTNEEEILKIYRRVRDEIKDMVLKIENYMDGKDE
ncbi:MAG: arsenate reductase [Bdellovibrio sp. CG12_big_fil_rev_8_21_14_0_65_39_13]|nr:MAG: arsenate reductase [Bdellovibrio sp. CG22_combo_CG10-13_8_21_14_all_39_27]PIQ62155.1 MAG: arsenate reductase [Bdellovibrio sp. CG12_big_fil_rev_8_21_14_0_65_39_13]PIR34168.1 MAG: arsenate reductase [Bdellovibrio sp. CG11_big_fil_rev_8_21_14_0_20_39_38]